MRGVREEGQLQHVLRRLPVAPCVARDGCCGALVAMATPTVAPLFVHHMLVLQTGERPMQ